LHIDGVSRRPAHATAIRQVEVGMARLMACAAAAMCALAGCGGRVNSGDGQGPSSRGSSSDTFFPASPTCNRGGIELPTADVFDGGPNDYDLTHDPNVTCSGDGSAHIRSKSSTPSGYAVLWSSLPALAYAGHRARFSAFIKTGAGSGFARLGVRVLDHAFDDIAGNNGEDVTLGESGDWTFHVVELDVPGGAATMVVGVMLEGGGEIWIDDVELVVH
jgi:serine/threonine-protein kinase